MSSRRTICVAILCYLFQGGLGRKSESHRFDWPDSYEVWFETEIPYVAMIQKRRLTYSTRMWIDRKQLLEKTITNDNDIIVTNLNDKTYGAVQWVTSPENDKLACEGTTFATQRNQHGQASADQAAAARKLRGSSSEDAASSSGVALPVVLPDLMDHKWQYNGTLQWEDKMAEVWVWVVEKNLGYGEYLGVYSFYTDAATRAPLYFIQSGQHIFGGAHADDYVMRYTHWKAGPVSGHAFSVPDQCQGVDPEPEQNGRHRNTIYDVIHKVMPNRHYGDAEYDAFVHVHGRRHADLGEYHMRRGVYYASKDMVEDCNSANKTYRCGLNKFADWTREELSRLSGKTKRQRDTSVVDMVQASKHGRLATEFSRKSHVVPESLDWRGSVQEGAVKDQALCGSCWAFSTIAGVEAAYVRATGQYRSLSEQYLMDCNWSENDEGRNEGCFGGFQDMAFDFLMSQGAIPSTDAYPYEGMNNFCRAKNMTNMLRFSGTWNVVDGGEDAVQAALVKKGPLAISIDAAADDWVFYMDGVMDNPHCGTRAEDLDHGVVLVGYGSSKDGVPYWIVKNTWGRHWGMDGYIYVARKPDDCGVTTVPTYVDMEVLQDLE